MHPPKLPLPGTVEDPLYPESDGKPMGDTDPHSDAVIWLRQALKDFFGQTPDVYVASQLMLYYEQGNPSDRRDPDAMVVRGVGKYARISFRVWEEGTLPCTVFEIASPRTWRSDNGAKRELYARLGIAEYIQFDPRGLYLDPPLQGFRLENGVHVPMVPDSDGSLESFQLGLRLLAERRMLRLIDAQTGRRILTRSERSRVRQDKAEAEGERAEQFRAIALEEKRRADEERRRADEERRRAEDESRRANEENRRAEAESRRASELAAEVARLREQLDNRDRPDTSSSPSH